MTAPDPLLPSHASRRSILRVLAVAPLLGACGGPSVLTQADLRPVPPEGLPRELPAPALRVGDEWRYATRSVLTGLTTDEIQLRVSAVDAEGYALAGQSQAAGAYEVRFDRDLNPVRNRNVAFEPAYPRYAFPLAIDKTWSGEVRTNVIGAPDQGTLLQHVRATVHGWERVTVPAGIFTALRIDLAVEWRVSVEASERGNSTESFWYAASVRNAVFHHRVDFVQGRIVTNNIATELKWFHSGA
ncbi:MAG: hypothetical protein LJE97_17170 [Betaproteobacteria bacterium]|nr:hypothetical protein [Betaproteobacteria bacterium]